jgi:hypothetical protein
MITKMARAMFMTGTAGAVICAMFGLRAWAALGVLAAVIGLTVLSYYELYQE